MNPSWAIHMKNKFPGCQVRDSHDSFDVYSASGEHLVAMRRNGAGQMLDVSEELGLSEKFDLAMIPRDARVHKIVGGKHGKDERAKERESRREEFIKDGKVLSCAELKAHGYDFSSTGEILRSPKKD